MDKKKKLLIVVGALLLVIGVSFGYYAMEIKLNGGGSKVEAITKYLGDVEIQITGNLDLDTDQVEEGILPGHKSISKIKLTATGEATTAYNLIWNGTNNLSTDINYTVYKTTTEVNTIANCNRNIVNVGTSVYYSEDCDISNLTSLGTSVKNGVIKSNTSEKVILLGNEGITPTNSGTTVYYYVVLEYPNTVGSQNADISTDEVKKSFNGTVTVEAINGNGGIGKDWILANSTVKYSDSPINLTKTSCSSGCGEVTVGLYCWDVGEEQQCTINDNSKNKTYFYRGDVTDNYVYFSGFYWRIVRINENGSIRMIYQGTTADTASTVSTACSFNNAQSDTPYIQSGFKYTIGSLHGVDTASKALDRLNGWYSNIKSADRKYLDINSGFCNDRSGVTYKDGMLDVSDLVLSMAGIDITDGDIIYMSKLRLNNQFIPASFNCANVNDLYTVNGSLYGNKSLTYPIGLITADEVNFAGGLNGSADSNGVANSKYYLNFGSKYWTMTPYDYSADNNRTRIFTVQDNGSMAYYSSQQATSSNYFVRPVINLKPEVILTGKGTATEPYQLFQS